MTKEELLIKIKDNGLIPYNDEIPTYIVCFNCGLERSLNTWLKRHGKNCKLPKLNTDRMT